MSYARIPSRSSLHGLGLYDDLPTATDVKNATVQTLKSSASDVGDAAKQQAIAFAQTQIANYPSQSEVLDQYTAYAKYLNAIPGFNPDDMQDPKKCVALMKQALLNYAADNGIVVPTTTAAAKAEAEQMLEAYALKVASGAVGIDLSQFSPLPTNARALEKAVVSLAVTAVIMQTGIDPKLVTVTAECLMDGKLSYNDCEAIGKCAGAIAGAIVGQAFGIPAPIGAFVGGLVGGMAGGTVGEIFGMGGDNQQAAFDRVVNAFNDWNNATLDAAQKLCTSALTVYWDTFDDMLAQNELRWQMAEVQIGWKFGARWFGQEHDDVNGRPFSQSWDTTTGKFTGPVTTANRAALLSKNTNYGIYASNGTLQATPVYWCPYDYGCPYPQGTPNLGAGPLERDAQAFLARGAAWYPASKRSLVCVFRTPEGDPAFNAADRDKWLSYIEQTVAGEQSAVYALKIISVSVSGDLVRSAAQAAAEKKMHDLLSASSTEILKAGLDRGVALSAAKRTGTQLSDFINYGALFIGVGVLGAAIYKRSQS